uniref:Uncharacterized protein n=1 Tax=Onchocerca volvulus TaxID=6282 RepID=A0A8R1TJ86_ONCVO
MVELRIEVIIIVIYSGTFSCFISFCSFKIITEFSKKKWACAHAFRIHKATRIARSRNSRLVVEVVLLQSILPYFHELFKIPLLLDLSTINSFGVIL